MPPILFGLVLLMNLVTFAAFGLDKAKARRGEMRTPEARLLLLAFATGFLGGWIGMGRFRHKTQKTSFQAKMVVVTLLNPAWVLLWLWVRG